MPTFAEMIQIYHEPPTEPAAETPLERDPWDVLTNRWPPLNLPEPPEPLTLAWVWSWVLLEPMPSWSGHAGSRAAEHVSRETWERLERCLEDGGGLPDDRLAWLRGHEAAVRSAIEQDKAAHFRRYPPRR